MGALRFRLTTLAALSCAFLSACVDSPSAPTPATAGDIPLATSFDDLAQEQSAAGDVDRSEEFSWAALAVRLGVTPTRFDVSNDGQRQTYDAFVLSVHWTLPTLALRPVGHRTLIAWRKEGDVMQVIIVSSQSDVAPILHPYSMRPSQPGGLILSPIAGASAAYFERGLRKSAWLGTGGQAKIVELSVGGKCNTPNDIPVPNGVSCELATYGVAFDATHGKAPEEKSRTLPSNAATKKLSAPEQKVAGVKMTFNCVLPLSDKGCR
jgi:hypothetical protein